MPSKVIIIMIQFMFMSKIFWALLSHSIACYHRVRLKTFLLLPVNINVIVLLIASLVLKKDQG